MVSGRKIFTFIKRLRIKHALYIVCSCPINVSAHRACSPCSVRPSFSQRSDACTCGRVCARLRFVLFFCIFPPFSSPPSRSIFRTRHHGSRERAESRHKKAYSLKPVKLHPRDTSEARSCLRIRLKYNQTLEASRNMKCERENSFWLYNLILETSFRK